MIWAITVAYPPPPLIGKPRLPNNAVHIREVSVGERRYHMHSRLSIICVLSRRVFSLNRVLSEWDRCIMKILKAIFQLINISFLAVSPIFYCNWTYHQRPIFRDYILYFGTVCQDRSYCTFFSLTLISQNNNWLFNTRGHVFPIIWRNQGVTNLYCKFFNVCRD